MTEPVEEKTTLDDSLRAIVAADRLGLSETVDGKDLLQRRLTVFYAYFALLSSLAALAGYLRPFALALEPAAVAFVRMVQSAHAGLLILVFLTLRFSARGGLLPRALDILATVATAASAAFALSAVRGIVTADVAAVAFFVLFFVVRAALVPSKPWLATLVAAVAAVPFAVGLGVMYRNSGPLLVPDPDAATFAAFRSMLAGVAGVYFVSRTIYGLRSAVEKAVKLGQYVIHEKIGEGGMGTVYRASHALLKRPTAIKVIPPDRAGETATARFEREVLATSRLTHPNTIAIYDFGRTRGGVFYYAMELLDGETLARLVAREGPQPAERTRHILRQVVAALAEAHEAGLVHRDVKPENIMLTTRGGVREFVKVLDFGLVKDVATEGGVKITNERALAGTPLYMAPEAILAPQSVGPAADIYAVGCVAYFLLCGRPPFDGDNVIAVCTAHVHDVPEAPSKYAPGMPPDLERLVLQCLEKKAEARPATRELEAALAN